MKKQYVIPGTIWLLVLLTSVTQGQSVRSKWTGYETITTLRLGTQHLNLDELNQALQQTGYGPLASQVPTIGLTSQITRTGRALGFYWELNSTFGPGMRATNGVNNVRTAQLAAILGVTYQVVSAGNFRLAPKLGLISLPYYLEVKQINAGTPSLTSVLTNPGNSRTATLNPGSIGIDAGLTASLKIPYKATQQYDCYSSDRSVVLALDAGYRVATRAAFDNSQELNSTNPSIQPSGWYAGVRVGFGRRVTKTGSPVVN